MRRLFRLFVLLLILSPFALGALLWFSLSDQPTIPAGKRLSHQDIDRARTLLEANDPRQLPAGSERLLQLDETDLNLAANYLAQKYVPGGARVVLHPGQALLDASLRLHSAPVRGYLNLSLALRETKDGTYLTGLRLGQVAVPDFISQVVIRKLIASWSRSRGASLALASIKELTLSERQIRLRYEWRPELLDAVQNELIPASQVDAMAAYYAYLLELQSRGKAKTGNLADALKPVFALAVTRSQTNDPAAENRAMLAVLGAWASGRGLGQLLPDQHRKAPLARFRLTLQRRGDFAQHFLTSAALAANGDTVLSDAVGLYKEMRDSQGGSGFSFTDIAADRAGTRFGEIASHPRSARSLQEKVASGLRADQLMPPARDLPEHMNAAEFERRFGGVDSPAYQSMMAEIENRIGSLPLYQ